MKLVLSALSFLFIAVYSDGAQAFLDVKKMYKRCSGAIVRVMERRVYLAFDQNQDLSLSNTEIETLALAYYNAFDTNQDKAFSKAEFSQAQDFIILETLKRTFTLFDPNRDGKAPIGPGQENIAFERDLKARGPEHAEITPNCQNLFKWAHRARFLGLVNTETYTQALRDLDLDKNNIATREEYIKVNQEEYRQDVRRLFRTYDLNKDGLVDIKEFAQITAKKV